MEGHKKNQISQKLLSRVGVETERFDPDGFAGGRTRAITDKLNLSHSIHQVDNEARIIERRLKDVSDPLSEEDEDSTPRSRQPSQGSRKSQKNKGPRNQNDVRAQ